MSNRTNARSVPPVDRVRSGARDVLLASLGAASLLRKGAAVTAAEAAGIASRLPQASSILIEGLGERAQAAKAAAVAQLARVDARLRDRIGAGLDGLPRQLQPILRKLGLARPAAAARKPATKRRKPVAKRVARKPRKVADRPGRDARPSRQVR